MPKLTKSANRRTNYKKALLSIIAILWFYSKEGGVIGLFLHWSQMFYDNAFLHVDFIEFDWSFL